jgi:hypothetical protein
MSDHYISDFIIYGWMNAIPYICVQLINFDKDQPIVIQTGFYSKCIIDWFCVNGISLEFVRYYYPDTDGIYYIYNAKISDNIDSKLENYLHILTLEKMKCIVRDHCKYDKPIYFNTNRLFLTNEIRICISEYCHKKNCNFVYGTEDTDELYYNKMSEYMIIKHYWKLIIPQQYTNLFVTNVKSDKHSKFIINHLLSYNHQCHTLQNNETLNNKDELNIISDLGLSFHYNCIDYDNPTVLQRIDTNFLLQTKFKNTKLKLLKSRKNIYDK